MEKWQLFFEIQEGIVYQLQRFMEEWHLFFEIQEGIVL